MSDMLKPVRWESAHTLAICSYVVIVVVIVYFGGLCRLPSSGFMNMYMYKLVITVFSTLIVFWAGNALLVLKGTTKLE
jgi:hypothetical protein